MNKIRGVKFESTSGNKYFYDDNSGMIFNIDKCNSKEESISQNYIEKIGKYEKPEVKNIKSKDVENFLVAEGNGFKQLIIELTTQCNLRCKYCCYSEYYQYSRGYFNSYITFETVKKAVNIYFENFKKVYYRNPLRFPVIGFYGGEPLLNFKVIKDTVNYIKENYPKLSPFYNITTNALLLTDEIGDFLVENDFSILISLDGDKESHDRNRVKVNGGGSYDLVMKNLNRLRERYPEYLKITISACYDPKTDLIKVGNFFDNEKLFVTKISAIDGVNTTYYNQFTQNDFSNYKNNLDFLRNQFLKKALENKLEKNSFLYSMIGVRYLEFSYHTMLIDKRTWLIPYTGCCIPGEKIYLSVDGKFHICEKINPNYSIGNIEKGIDYEKIASLINSYNEVVCKNCENCNITKLCSYCFTKCSNNEMFAMDKQNCILLENNIKETLKEYVDILEEKPELLEAITVDYYNNILKRVGEGC